MKTLKQRVLGVLKDANPANGVAVLDGKDGYRKLAYRAPREGGGFVVTVLDPPDAGSAPALSVSQADPADLGGIPHPTPTTPQTARGQSD